MQILDIFHRRIALALLAALALPATAASDKIWRCGNEYTNQPGDAKARGCKPVEGGNLTVIDGLKPQASVKPAPSAPSPARTGGQAARGEGERVNSAEQRARDSDARAILEAELRKAEARLAELRLEYKDGNPEPRPEELRNPPLHQQRTAALKEQVGRAEADVAALRRELARVVPAPDKK
ncbi:hypothetical protein [Malikia sp.]|uniref:hypothetical protein n=1 Tax=Malikia sp. TaxID=2070706 RepID=UPI002629DFED|nr:hypothetical protein [Malikia sp.]MDD2728127.1 hypothetical protein [Malikia sp.]